MVDGQGKTPEAVGDMPMVDGQPKDLNKKFLNGIRPADLLMYVERLRRNATAIVPPEVDLIQDERVKEVILASFGKVGDDMATLADAITRLIAIVEARK